MKTEPLGAFNERAQQAQDRPRRTPAPQQDLAYPPLGGMGGGGWMGA